MFVDEAEVTVIAGDGGDGIVAFRKEKYVAFGGPNGGDGGKGGDVVFVATNNAHTLSDFRHRRQLKAKPGQKGGINNMTGRGGEDAVVDLPVGTLIYDEEDNLLADLIEPGQRVVVAVGGGGGLGNYRFKSSTRRTPRHAMPGFEGESKKLRLALKLIADVALVGYPSVGKSTLIASMSNARPKIAAYHFTTLAPNLGVVPFGDFEDYVIADVPGLIEGASDGHGLGIQFLKHIERTKLIAHIIEVTPQMEGHEDERNPIDDFARINAELAAYADELQTRKQVVVLNKIDLPFVAEKEPELRAHFEGLGFKFYAVSGVSRANLKELKTALGKALGNVDR